MSRFWDQVDAIADRMADSEGCRWWRELAPSAARIGRGSFYADGPICLIAYRADGSYLGSVIEADADRMRNHPNSRPTQEA